MSIKIATWNVNSIKSRLSHVEKWLESNNVDVLMLQELKGIEFPADAFQKLGYTAEIINQKAYNGVAILTKENQKKGLTSLPGNENDDQARYIESEYKGLHLINIYLPNGNPVDSEKYPYKLAWMDRLYARTKELLQHEIPFVIGGDFNIIPADEDCHDPKVWQDDALFRLESRKKWRALVNLGLTDSFRILNAGGGHYTFWDYQAGAWQKNNGIRIDHFLLSPQVTDRFINCIIDKKPRGEEKASDHTPVILELAA